jgi:uncharacterized membrane protein YdjX (TVP38/TMEM64 family)
MPSDADPNLSETRRESYRLLIGAGFVALLIVVLHFTPLKQWLAEAQKLKAHIDDYGWTAHAVFILASIVGIALGLPRLVLCALGGMLFGFVEGLLASQFAGVMGSYGAFLLTRWWAPKGWVQRKLAKSEKLRSLLAHPSIMSIFIARQMPVPGIVPNVLLGVLPTKHRTFLLGTFIGYLPSNIPVALAGSSMGKETLATAIAQVSISMVALGAFSALIVWLRRKYRE